LHDKHFIVFLTGGNVSPPWNVEPLFSKSVTILSVSGPAGSSATGSGGKFYLFAFKLLVIS